MGTNFKNKLKRQQILGAEKLSNRNTKVTLLRTQLEIFRTSGSINSESCFLLQDTMNKSGKLSTFADLKHPLNPKKERFQIYQAFILAVGLFC